MITKCEEEPNGAESSLQLYSLPGQGYHVVVQVDIMGVPNHIKSNNQTINPSINVIQLGG